MSVVHTSTISLRALATHLSLGNYSFFKGENSRQCTNHACSTVIAISSSAGVDLIVKEPFQYAFQMLGPAPGSSVIGASCDSKPQNDIIKLSQQIVPFAGLKVLVYSESY